MVQSRRRFKIKEWRIRLCPEKKKKPEEPQPKLGYQVLWPYLAMDEAHSKQYDDEGFTLVENIVPPSLLARIQSETDRLIAEAAGN